MATMQQQPDTWYDFLLKRFRTRTTLILSGWRCGARRNLPRKQLLRIAHCNCIAWLTVGFLLLMAVHAKRRALGSIVAGAGEF